MNSLKDTLAYWTTILGTVAAFFGLVQSFTWLAGIGVLLVTGSMMAIAYAQRQRQLLKLANVRVEGLSIDSLNMANLRRHVNRTLVIQDAFNTATIRGEDLTVRWRCSGYCRARFESAIDFSIDADNNIPFAQLDCFAYDLCNDPERRHKIRPVLIGPDGISKKVAIPFLALLRQQERFDVEFTCELPHCMKPGRDYYIASLSFAQDRVNNCCVQLIFEPEPPDWVRVYNSDSSGRSTLLYDLAPEIVSGVESIYLDSVQNPSARSSRVYFFHRDTA